MGCKCSCLKTDKTSVLTQFEMISSLSGSGVIRTQRLEDHYVIHEGFEATKLGVFRTGHLKSSPERVHAVNSIYKKISGEVIQRLDIEICVLPEISHPNIEKVYKVFETESAVHITMDMICGSSLREYSTKNSLNESESASIIRQVISGVRALHMKEILHKNLTLDTVFIENGNVLIRGIGVSRELIVSSHSCKAPECLNGYYYESTDVWDIGVLTFELVASHHPFDLSKIDMLDSLNVSESCRSFLKKTLKREFVARLSIDDALIHPWLSNSLRD